MSKLMLVLLTIVAIALIGCGEEPSRVENLPHPGCTLTYAAGTPSYVFIAGQFGSAQGGVLADGDCYGVGQSISPPLPGGLEFSVDRGGRRWKISGTPTETADANRYTIQAKATIGSGPATQDTSRSIELRVEP